MILLNNFKFSLYQYLSYEKQKGQVPTLHVYCTSYVCYLIIVYCCLPDIIRKNITQFFQVGDVEQGNLLIYQSVEV